MLHIALTIWFYGLENFCWDVEFMLKWKVTIFWRLTWTFITPGLLISIFSYTMSQFKVPTYMGTDYPLSFLIGGWFVFIFLISWNLFGFFTLFSGKNMKKALISLFKVDELWGPKSPFIFKEWKTFKAQKLADRKVQSASHSKIKKLLWKLLGKYK